MTTIVCERCHAPYSSMTFVTCPHCAVRDFANGQPIAPRTGDVAPEEQPELPGIESTLAERGARYGRFQDHAATTNALIETLERSKNWSAMPAEMKQALRVIMDKAGRMCTGDFLYGDNWHDMIGYAKLGERCCERLKDCATDES